MCQAHAGGADGFLVKVNSTGAWKWTRLFGFAGEERVRAIAVSRLGRIVVSGSTGDSDLTQAGSSDVQVVSPWESGGALGGEDAFVVAFSPDGARTWSTEPPTS